ncbi:LPS export ABC transporter periplasmic protein LptC [Candidatus Pelagibacter sp.]|nr:LPS export ABC transporter periplasmic protein LptC [Candidatus Pelagibacter sp.]|tara:strand:- start:99 stop:683 length:585 start_codon:yes stop_codon:yes gene_type:complete
MNKKTVTQIILIILIFVISLLFYLKYFINNPKSLKNTSSKEKFVTNTNSSSTYIDNIDYIASDSEGNRYQITAEQAEIETEDSNLMFLKNVTAYVFIKNSDKVKITSKFGKYNSKNYDTIFSENVIVIYPGHKITGEYLDFSFINNLGIFTTNVIYTGVKTNLFADKIEMNLATKDTKIFMNDAEKKVLIEGTK